MFPLAIPFWVSKLDSLFVWGDGRSKAFLEIERVKKERKQASEFFLVKILLDRCRTDAENWSREGRTVPNGALLKKSRGDPTGIAASGGRNELYASLSTKLFWGVTQHTNNRRGWPKQVAISNQRVPFADSSRAHRSPHLVTF